ncbi:hypothetical protein KKD37_02650 [Patescibacteria group bacterium]|nr:hypothetical protein [Patescibacteria group bacterium]
MGNRAEESNKKFLKIYINGQKDEAAMIDAVHGDGNAGKAEKASRQIGGRFLRRIAKMVTRR